MHKIKYTTKKELWNLAFVAPGLLLFTLFTYYPLILNVYYSLTSWNGRTAEKEFVGLKNYLSLLKDSSMLQAMENTVYFAVILIILGVILQLGTALIIYNRPKGHGFIKVVLYLPAVLSPIILSYTWIQFLQYTGYLNQLLEVLKLADHAKNWLLNVDTVKLWLCVIQTLQFVGYGMIFFLTGLNTIPKDIYEAAELDGAHGWKKFRHITLPLIMPSITVTLFISITGALNTYAIPFALTGGGPNDASTTITMQIYKQAFSFSRFGYACAISLVFFVFIAIVSCAQLLITRKKEVEY